MNTRLYRSRDDRMLAGVAGGLAELWDADPSLVRIVWALLVVLTGGIALVVYIVMAIVVPEEDAVGGHPPATWVQPAPGTATPSADPTIAAPGVAPGAFAAAGAPPSAFAATGDPHADRHDARVAARDARHAARAARRAGREHDGRTAPLIVGSLLIIVGAWFLVRRYVPAIDFDWFWPIAIVALGVLVLAMAIRQPHDGRDPRSPGPNGPSGPSGPP